MINISREREMFRKLYFHFSVQNLLSPHSVPICMENPSPEGNLIVGMA